jgi:large subunit ribosomal protein L24
VQATKPVKDPRKQRKRLYNAPAHLRHKLIAAPLAPELISSKGAKALPVRKGDTVRIVRGDHIGFEGKVSRVDLKRYRIFLEGLTREKVDGTSIFVSVHPSKVMIKNLKLDDKWRKGILENKKEIAAKKEVNVEKAVKKPPKKTKAVKTKEKITEKKAEAQEKPAGKAQTAAKKKVQKKPVAKKKVVEKPAAKKKVTSVAKKAAPEKEQKSKPAKKAPAKRKAPVSKKKGEK